MRRTELADVFVTIGDHKRNVLAIAETMSHACSTANSSMMYKYTNDAAAYNSI